jgi:hypothetical protein
MTHNQIEHILIDRRNLSVLGIRSFRGVACDTDHYLVVAKVRERVAVSKRATQKFGTGRFDVKKIHEVEGKERYQVRI